MIEVLALLTGIFWKLYDDYADNKEAYSFLSKYELGLEVLMLACSLLFAFFDNIFLLYLVIIIISDCILYIIKENNDKNKVNYAVDTDIWKLGGVITYCLFILRVPSILNTFTALEYGVIALAITFIGIEIVSQFTEKKEIIEDEKENHLFLEASNKKLTTRIIELFLFFLFFYVVLLQYKSALSFKNVILFAISYIYISISSILYLKYYYFYREGKPMFEK